MSTRWFVIVVVAVFVAVLTVALVRATGDHPAPVAPPAPGPASPAASDTAPGSPSSPTTQQSPSPSPAPTASARPATSFVSTGEPASGWFWLRDAAHRATATWMFATVPAHGDLVLDVEVVASDAADGDQGQDARFFLAWAPAVPRDASGWSGRLPVTLPVVAPSDDPAGRICRGTVTIPRPTLAAAATLAVRISREDVRGELGPSDTYVAVNAAGVRLRFP